MSTYGFGWVLGTALLVGCAADISEPTSTAVEEVTCGRTHCALPNANATCARGRCAIRSCYTTTLDCNHVDADGCEVDAATSVTSCGSCGRACPTPPHSVAACTGGACGFTCSAGFGDCDRDPTNGCEVDLNNDSEHCGRCDSYCASPTNTDYACCAGRCTYMHWDNNNCGGCGIVCQSGPSWSAWCGYDACNVSCYDSHFGNCDGNSINGCETNLFASDLNNCGACGNVCATPQNSIPVCEVSSCGIYCQPGFASCDGANYTGCEVDTRSDNANCGACGNACPAGSSCVGSVCSGG